MRSEIGDLRSAAAVSAVESEEKRIRGKEGDGQFSIQRKDSGNEE